MPTPTNHFLPDHVDCGCTFKNPESRERSRDSWEMLCMRITSLLLAAAALCCVYREARAAVIAIDFGSEWMKIALVKPGVPMEIVLNKESKRKTAAAVSIRNGERLLGDAALSTSVKHPKCAYRYLQLLLGQKFDSPLVKKYREWFPFYDMKKDEERGTVLFQHDSDTIFTPEELVGMMLNYSRHLAEEYAGQSIRDVVITVPPFFSQAQRRAMLQAAELVSLKVLQLISNTAAAALNYGLFRQATFNSTPQYIMFYDMGAAATTATIIEYRLAQVREGSVVNTHPQLAVKGTVFDRTLGGLEMEFRLRDFLAGKFEAMKKTQGSVYDSPRAMAKLLKEAKRLKQVLSANTEHFAQIEGLLEDVDFRFKVTRADFEELCSDLLDRVEKPVTQALKAADMTMPEMDAVILVGGGTRVPRVQEVLLAASGKVELGKSLNTDEAPVLGAVYQGAGRTKLFRVKKFIVKEGNCFPIQVSFTRHTVREDGEEVAKTVTRTLFQRSNAYPQKKVLTFNRYSDDFAFSVFYGDLDFLSPEEKSYLGRVNLTEVYLAGVGGALQEHSRAEPNGIKAHFRMDESGLLHLVNVESIFEYPEEEEQSTLSKIGSTLSSFFGGGSSSKSEESEGGAKESEGGAKESEGGAKESEGGAKEEEEEKTGESQTTAEPETEQPDDDGGQQDEQQESHDQEEESHDQEEASHDQEEASHDQEEESHDQEEESHDQNEESHDQEEESHDQEEESHDQDEESLDREEEPSDQEEEDIEFPEEQVPEGGEEEEVEGDGEGEGEGGQEGEGRDDDESEKEEQQATEAPTNDTTSPKTKPGKKKAPKEKAVTPKGRTVKVNLTAEVTTLDLPPPSTTSTQASADKLRHLQEQDEEKAANEAAKNNLEAHVFETQDAMYSEGVVAVTTEEQREVILSALREAADWLDEDGWAAETQVYKTKLRELKKISRAAFRRVSEAVRRPKAVAVLQEGVRVSRDFVARMRNLSDELQIFTEVEINTLETLANESEEWLAEKEALQATTPPHEDPALLSHEVEEQTRRVDREVLYLLNKLRTHPPPKRPTPNATNATDTKTKAENATTIEEDDTVAMETEEPEGEVEPEILELPEAEPATEAAEPSEGAAAEATREQMSATDSSSHDGDQQRQEL